VAIHGRLLPDFAIAGVGRLLIVDAAGARADAAAGVVGTAWLEKSEKPKGSLVARTK
jgi:hypothetical protein